MIISLFFFIVLLNWIGLVVYTFSLTSILFFSLTMSFIVFIGNLLIAINKLRFKVLLFFVPKNVPYWLLPLLIWIELISFFIRGFSLGLRLFANILSGHLLLLIISFFLNIMLYNISNSLWININTIIIFLILNIILWLEIFVNIIQGYIFYILSATYLKEIVEKF